MSCPMHIFFIQPRKKMFSILFSLYKKCITKTCQWSKENKCMKTTKTTKFRIISRLFEHNCGLLEQKVLECTHRFNFLMVWVLWFGSISSTFRFKIKKSLSGHSSVRQLSMNSGFLFTNTRRVIVTSNSRVLRFYGIDKFRFG